MRCKDRDDREEVKCSECEHLHENGGQCGGCTNWFIPKESEFIEWRVILHISYVKNVAMKFIEKTLVRERIFPVEFVGMKIL